MEVIVKQEGILEFNGKKFPWRVIGDCTLQVYEETKNLWKTIKHLEEVIK